MFILRAAAGVMPRLGAKRAALNQRSFSRCNGVLVECRRRQVPTQLRQIFEAEFIGTVGTVPHALLLHASPPKTAAFIAKPLAGSLDPRRGSCNVSIAS